MAAMILRRSYRSARSLLRPLQMFSSEPGASAAMIKCVSQITPTVKLLELQVNESLRRFSPGQWVDLFIPGQPIVGGYSILSTQHELPLLRLAVKNGKHPPTAWCFNDAKVGDKVEVRVGGTFGLDFECSTSTSGAAMPAFALPADTRRVVLIAGGIGINPLYSMLKQFTHMVEHSPAHAGMPEEVVLLYGARSRDELAFEKDIRALALQFPERVQVTFVVPEDCSGEDTKTPSSRFVQESKLTRDLVAGVVDPTRKSLFFLCGPRAMIEAVEEDCALSGVAKDRIHYERWW